ncbi:two pore domain potassium channel family protein [Flavobacterium sp. ZT3R18]|uniref:potassium channel family protein n=1 Tax=Flavobacterium sp. ZT3R18 TaxID=2594429 RepID=UPI00117B649A|nr:potassium channel family protein [Flavobacterium sp. ZT3R18]TRX37238.1 two pore domain potassium channel family protein [Flavobacterium sp. ZT3R18]
MTRQKKIRFLNHFWDKESGLSGMLVLLFAMHFVLIPLFGSYSSFMVTINIFWMLFLVAGIISLSKTKRQAIQISIIPFLFMLFGWINVFDASPFFIMLDIILTICTFGLLIFLVLVKVFEPGPITGYRVIGSIVVYMILANLWAVIYLFTYEQIPGSFSITLPPFESNTLQANFLYFSYITITTTGFGEIVPLHPFARSLVQIEAIIGVLYPVILIGRLVSDANENKAKKKQKQ